MDGYPLEERQYLYGIPGWSVTIHEREKSPSGDMGTVDCDNRYREATVWVYREDIRQRAIKYPEETPERVIDHELCEIAIDEYARGLPGHVVDDQAFVEFCDCVAEHMRRCIENAYYQGIEDGQGAG